MTRDASDAEYAAVTAALRGWSPDGRMMTELAWALVRRENAELRKSHPRAYAWARAWLDAERAAGRLGPRPKTRRT